MAHALDEDGQHNVHYWVAWFPAITCDNDLMFMQGVCAGIVFP